MFSKSTFVASRQTQIAHAEFNGRKPPEAGFDLALLILSSVFEGKKHQNGQGYAEHLVTIGMKFDDSDLQIISFLQGIVKYSDWNIQDLRLCGFSDRILNGVDSAVIIQHDNSNAASDTKAQMDAATPQP